MKDIYGNNVEVNDIVLFSHENSLLEGIITKINDSNIDVKYRTEKFNLMSNQFILKYQPRYFISGLEKMEIENNLLNCGNVHCFGYYEDYNEALESVLNNWGDFYQDKNNYLLIEKVYSGVQEISTIRTFFKYDKTSKSYILITEPKEVKKYCNFSIG